jgi:thioredoxin reductase (NADPH)
VEQVVILGSGPAGLTAAIYAGRSLLNPLVITGNALGGQAATSAEIENYPGFPDGVGGMDLTQLMQRQAERFGARVEIDEVTAVDLSSHPFKVTTYAGAVEAKTLIVATGVAPRLLGIPGEAELKGRGVSYCATCDGFFYKDKIVVVVGGGDSAVEEANYLTRFASRVYIVHRRAQLRAQKIAQERVAKNPKITFVLDSALSAILGEDSVTGVRVRNLRTGAVTDLATDGVFSYVGNVPNTQLLQGQLALDESGYVATDRQMHTNVPGVFAAGDVQELVLKQVSTAVGTAAIAAMEADKFLAELEGRSYPPR